LRQYRDKLIPLLLTLGIIVADQITKQLVVVNLDHVHTSGHVVGVFGDVVRLIHARNPAIAFSMGKSLSPVMQQILFTAIPVLVLGLLLLYYFRSSDLSVVQRWAVAGIVGGGAGNLIDRVFRSGGVVDFIDVKFFGLFGLERWPTFNLADASVVVCGMLLVVTIFLGEGNKQNE
jgi:signal peptidase II